MKKDYHLHTDFSADSQMKLSELIPLAISLGYDEIAVTEHLDLLPQELAVFGIPSLIKYRNQVDYLRKQHSGIKVIWGIEVGDFQDVKDFADPLLQQMQFELVLGSVHFTGDHINVAIPLKKPLSKDEIRQYYKNNLRLVETCGIDVLAHLGVYKRYYTSLPDEKHCLPIITDIFKTIIDQEIALELNLACLRKPYNSLIPEHEYLELYQQLGGKLIAIGSDSHSLEHFDFQYDTAYSAIIKYGFEHLKI
ncbi:MAG: histidinol-phosphatase HisJ family protein [Candidatus Cloacimonadaceae bacterium]